jgi:hypothetical protein
MDGEDSSIGGRWFYHRCQMLLSSERERPSLSTMQCYIYSAVYLWNASFFNLAHETLAVAVRAAHSLGIHHKSSNHLPEVERHLFQRIWWALFCLDTKACTDLGRPFSIHLSDVTRKLPADNLRNAIIPESRLQLTHEGLSYLEYHSQCVGLLLAAQTIHATFYRKCMELITNMEGKSLQDDPTAYEIAAKILNGIYQAYQYQWEAIISMLGFALFRPICPFASSTSKAIQIGITSLEIFGANNFATALSAANVARSLSEYIDLHSKSFQNQFHEVILNAE